MDVFTGVNGGPVGVQFRSPPLLLNWIQKCTFVVSEVQTVPSGAWPWPDNPLDKLDDIHILLVGCSVMAMLALPTTPL